MALGASATSMKTNSSKRPSFDKLVGPVLLIHNLVANAGIATNVQELEHRWLRNGQSYASGAAVSVVINKLSALQVAQPSTAEAKCKPKNQPGKQVDSPPIDVLNFYKRSFIREEPQVNFDYLNFYALCGKMVDTLLMTIGLSHLGGQHRNPHNDPNVTVYAWIDDTLWDSAKQIANGTPVSEFCMQRSATPSRSPSKRRATSSLKLHSRSPVVAFRKKGGQTFPCLSQTQISMLGTS